MRSMWPIAPCLPTSLVNWCNSFDFVFDADLLSDDNVASGSRKYVVELDVVFIDNIDDVSDRDRNDFRSRCERRSCRVFQRVS